MSMLRQCKSSCGNDDELSGGIDAAFQYEKSISNQCIAAFSSQLQRSCIDWRIRYFRQVLDTCLYDITNNLHVECMKFVYMRLIQQELDQIRCTWNSPQIRAYPTTDPDGRPSCRPDILY